MRRKYFVILFTCILFFAVYYFLFAGSKEEEIVMSNNDQISSWGVKLLTDDKSPPKNDKVKVAILDSGINKEHEDLKHIKFKEYNALEKGSIVKDDFGHGTAIAGIIAAKDNNFGVVGLLQNVEIYDVKFLDSNGNGSVDDLIDALIWSIENEVDIINLSFGFQTEDTRLRVVIDQAINNNIVIVASIGNTYGMRGDYPAVYNDVFSITSINNELFRSTFSSKKDIDFAMPGEDIYTTDKDGGYSTFSGTSFATAHATGIIAQLLIQYRYDNNNYSSDLGLKQYLIDHSYSKLNWEFDDYGNGILQLRKEDKNENFK